MATKNLSALADNSMPSLIFLLDNPISHLETKGRYAVFGIKAAKPSMEASPSIAKNAPTSHY
jgi:hypothetical protein